MNESMNKNEAKLEAEIKKEEVEIRKLALGVRALAVIIFLVLAALVGTLAYFKLTAGKVSIDKSEVSAPEIDLASSGGGELEEMYVKKGDHVTTGEPVARVGNELIEAKTDGTIIAADAVIGKLYDHGQTVVAMIASGDLRIVGHLDENKGLDLIKVGDYATFTVDAFGSKQYQGVVDEVSPTSRQSDVVFSISDQRPTNVFDIKVRFDSDAHPELKNGMSARLTIYTK